MPQLWTAPSNPVDAASPVAAGGARTELQDPRGNEEPDREDRIGPVLPVVFAHRSAHVRVRGRHFILHSTICAFRPARMTASRRDRVCAAARECCATALLSHETLLFSEGSRPGGQFRSLDVRAVRSRIMSRGCPHYDGRAKPIRHGPARGSHRRPAQLPAHPKFAASDAADRPGRHDVGRVGHPVRTAFMALRIDHAIAFRAEPVGKTLVRRIRGRPQFGALYLEGPFINLARGRLGAGRQSEQQKEASQDAYVASPPIPRTVNPRSLNHRASLAELAPRPKTVCRRTENGHKAASA